MPALERLRLIDPEPDVVFNLEFHPLADRFPMMPDQELEGLVRDIRSNGQQQAIILHEGRILDGRNRYLACREIGVEPNTDDAPATADPVALCISLNVQRRHLTPGQRAMCMAPLANLGRGQPEHKKSNGPQGPLLHDNVVSIDDAAKIGGVSPNSIKRAKYIHEHGTPEEIVAVTSGRVAVVTACTRIKKRLSGDTVPEARAASGPKVAALKKMSPEELSDAIATYPTIAAAAKGLGGAQINLTQVQTIVALSRRDDLNEVDTLLANDALELLRTSKQASPAFKLICSLAHRVFGPRRNASGSKRLEQFWQAFGIITQSCNASRGVDVPQLPRDEQARINEELKEARRALEAFAARIKEQF